MPSPLDELGDPIDQVGDLDALGDPLDSLGDPVDAPVYGQPQTSVRLNLTPDAELTPGPVSTFEADGQVPEFLRYQPPLPTKVPGRQEQNKRAYAAGSRRRTSSEPAFEAGPLRVYPTSGPQTGPLTAQRGNALDFDAELDLHALDIPATLDWNSGALFSGATDAAMLGQADAVAGAIGGPEVMQNVQRYSQMARENNPGSYVAGALGGSAPMIGINPIASSAVPRVLQMGAFGAGVGGAGQVTRNIVANRPLTQDLAGEALSGMALMGGGQMAAETLAGAPAAWMRETRRGLAEQRALSNAVTPSERAAVRQAVAEEMPYPTANLPELGPAPQRPLRERMPVRQPAEPIPARLPQPPLASAVRPAPSGQISPDMRRLANHGIADTIQFNEGEEVIAADIADRMFAGTQNQLDRFGAATRSLRGIGQQYEQLASAGRGVRVDTRDMLREAERVAALNPDDALTQDAIERLRRAVSIDRISNSPPTAAFDELHRIKVEAGPSPIGRVIRDALVRGAPDDLAQQMVALDTEFKIARDVQSRGRGVSQFVSDEQAAQASQAQYQERLNNYQRAVQDITARNNARNSRYLESVSRANTAEEIAAAHESAMQQYMSDMAQRNATREEIIAGRRELSDQIREINQARNLDVQERVREIANERRIQNQYGQIGIHDVGVEAGRRLSTGALNVVEYIVDSPHLVASTIGKILPAEAIELLSRSRKNGTMAAAVYQLSHSYPNFSQYVVEPSHPEE